MNEKKACSEKSVATACLRMHYHPCTRNVVVNREGKWWCKIHDPVYQKEKQAKRQKAYEEKLEKQYSPYKKIEELQRENEELRKAVAYIAALDPEKDSEEGFNEWGETDCFRMSQSVAKAVLEFLDGAPSTKTDLQAQFQKVADTVVYPDSVCDQGHFLQAAFTTQSTEVL